jgi:hypothetical protein
VLCFAIAWAHPFSRTCPRVYQDEVTMSGMVAASSILHHAGATGLTEDFHLIFGLMQ